MKFKPSTSTQFSRELKALGEMELVESATTTPQADNLTPEESGFCGMAVFHGGIGQSLAPFDDAKAAKGRRRSSAQPRPLDVDAFAPLGSESMKYLRRSIAPGTMGVPLSTMIQREKKKEIEITDPRTKQKRKLKLPPLKPPTHLTTAYERKAPKWTVSYYSFVYR